MPSLLTVLLLMCIGYAEADSHTRAEIATRHAVTGANGTIYMAIYAHRQDAALDSIGINRTEIAKALGPPYPINRVWVTGAGPEEIHDTFWARWYVTYSDDGRPVKVERAAIMKDARANQAAQVKARKLAELDR